MYSYRAKISVAHDHQTLYVMDHLPKHFAGIERHQKRILADFNFSSYVKIKSKIYQEGIKNLFVTDIFKSITGKNKIPLTLEIKNLGLFNEEKIPPSQTEKRRTSKGKLESQGIFTKADYKKWILKHHPDRNPNMSEEELKLVQEINFAYNDEFD